MALPAPVRPRLPLVTRMGNRLRITPREAAALDRLLDAYVGNEDGDPGMDDLRVLQQKVGRLDQDHTAYEAFRAEGGAGR